jgi:GH15 family glucan-1,4-alpha-glucosidase
VWQEPDAGIWEMRGPPRHFTFSKVMAWVAFDRGVRTAEQFSLAAPIDRWRRTRHTIHETVCRRGFNQTRRSFTQAFETNELDASLLLLPTVGFLPVGDVRIRDTIAAIERELQVDGVRSSPAHSGWLTPLYCRDDVMTQSTFSTTSYRWRMTSGCFRKNTIRGPGDSSATFLRRSRMLP